MSGKKRRKDESDDDWQASEEEASPQPAKRGKAAAEPDSEDEDSEGINEDELLQGLNELDREMLVYEREQARQRKREMKQLLKKAKKKPTEPVEVRASTRRVKSQTGTEGAVAKLAAIREQREVRAQQQKEAQQQSREPLDTWDEEGLDSDEAPADSDDERHEAASDDEEDQSNERADVTDALAAQATRSLLEKWVNEPHFDKTAPGCLVRYAYGDYTDDNGNVQPNYMVMRIGEVVVREGDSNYRPYKFGPAQARTNKWLRLEESGHLKAMTMTQVSNSKFTQQEYDRYARHREAANMGPITKGDIQKVVKQLEEAKNYKYTLEDIKRRAAENRSRGAVLGTYAQAKSRLELQITKAQQNGDEEEVERLTAELQALEEAAAQKRAAAGDSMAMFNQRAKEANFQALQAKDKGEAAAENGGVDVFSRRQTRSINYWATNRRGAASAADKAAAGDATPPPGSTPPPGATPPPGTPGSSSKPFDIVEAAKQLDLQPVDLSHIRLDPEVRKAKALLHACLGPNWRPEAVDLTGKQVMNMEQWKKRAKELYETQNRAL